MDQCVVQIRSKKDLYREFCRILRSLDSVGIQSEGGGEIVYSTIKHGFDENETETPYGTVWSGSGLNSDLAQYLLV